MSRGKRVGVVGVSGYGGGEILRLCALHPAVQVVYVAGESSAGQRLGSRYPGLSGALAALTIQAFDPHHLPDLDLLFLSLQTVESRKAAAALPHDLKVVDVGGDHRFVDGWTYGLTEITGPATIAESNRVADPGCFPAAALLALAPLVARNLVEPMGIIVDAKTGISGAGRGGGSTFGYAEVNEDVSAYNLFKHAHAPEMREALSRMAGGVPVSLVFSPHLVPMTRGLLATCYGRGRLTTDQALRAAREEMVDERDQLTHAPQWSVKRNLVQILDHDVVIVAFEMPMVIAPRDKGIRVPASHAVNFDSVQVDSRCNVRP